MISLFESASERDVERFAARLREGLKSKFSFTIGQSKFLHLLAEINGFNNWQSFKVGLERKVPQYVVDLFLDDPEMSPDDILAAEEKGSVVYVAVRRAPRSEIQAVVLYPRPDNWWKPVWENEGPFAEECPERILDLLSDTDNENALSWRKRCRIRASREGEFDTEELPYRQLFHLAFPIEVDGVSVSHFVRSTKDTFEGIDRQCQRVQFGFADFVSTTNIAFTTIPEYRNSRQSVQEVVADPFSVGLRLFSIGGDQPVDILVDKSNRIVSWCGYSQNLRDQYGDHAEGGFFDQMASSRGDRK